MIPKKNRINKKLFDIVFKQGLTIHNPVFMFKFLKKSPDNIHHFSFVVPKSVAKSAVLRNKLKRIGYNFLQTQDLPNIIGIFFYKKNTNNLPKEEINQEIQTILKNFK